MENTTQTETPKSSVTNMNINPASASQPNNTDQPSAQPRNLGNHHASATAISAQSGGSPALSDGQRPSASDVVAGNSAPSQATATQPNNNAWSSAAPQNLGGPATETGTSTQAGSPRRAAPHNAPEFGAENAAPNGVFPDPRVLGTLLNQFYAVCEQNTMAHQMKQQLIANITTVAMGMQEPEMDVFVCRWSWALMTGQYPWTAPPMMSGPMGFIIIPTAGQHQLSSEQNFSATAPTLQANQPSPQNRRSVDSNVSMPPSGFPSQNAVLPRAEDVRIELDRLEVLLNAQSVVIARCRAAVAEELGNGEPSKKRPRNE